MLQTRTLLAAAAGWALISALIALPAAAALLSSGGSNDNHVGVVNYAHSYDGDTIVLNVDCTHGSARNSEFKAATFCKSGSGSCAAHSSTANNNASLSIPPHQKGDLYYYASNHSGSGQGTCAVSLDAETAGNLATFTLDFNYYSNDQDAFTVSFRDLSAGWVPTDQSGAGAACPGTGVAGASGPTAKGITTNNKPAVAQNVICNEDFIVSLVSGGPRSGCPGCYPVNHGALLTLNNNPGGLQQAWQESLAALGITVAQILLTPSDTEERRRHLNARATIETLLQMGAVPVINENDSVATDEIRYGDNDRLAARVAQMISADTLVLMSDVDGLYDTDPRQNKNAQLIAEVVDITPEIEVMAGAAPAGYSSGGMVTKLEAAKIAMAAGCAMAITDGKPADALSRLESGGRCTWFLPNSEPLTARKRWIAGMVATVGAIIIDDGAVAALRAGKSLLPAGVTGVEGSFDRGDAIVVKTPDRRTIGRGLTAYSSADAALIMGRKSRDIEDILGYRGRDEMIHRDDLVTEPSALEAPDK